MSDQPGDPRFEVILASAERALDRQARAIDELRARAAGLLGAAAISAGFLGAEALKSGDALLPLTWIGVLAFAACGISCAWVLLPRKFTFVGSPKKLIEHRIMADEPDDQMGVDQLRWAVAVEMEDWYDANEVPRAHMWKAVTAAAVGLVVEIGAWLVLLALR